MDAYVRSFRLPPGMTACLIHDGSGQFSTEAYQIKVAYRLNDGRELCAYCRLTTHHYAFPDGIKDRKASVKDMIAALVGQCWWDYFTMLNGGAAPAELYLNVEPDRRGMARAW